MKIGVLTSGGDCPGLNAVLHGVTGAARELGWEVYGFLDGFEGLLQPASYRELTRKDTVDILRTGGTILGTTNKGSFSSRVGGEDKSEREERVLKMVTQTFDELGLEALIVVGGDGSLSIANKLFKAGFPIIGVPKTIDNDLQATAMTFGFDSAVNCVVDALDRLHTTTLSHKRVMVVEVMGRNAGWIALWGGIAGHAHVILLPEIEFDLDKVAVHIKAREEQGYHSSMVVVAEGAKMPGGDVCMKKNAGKNGGDSRLGGIGEFVANELGERTGKDVRTCILGHLQRGGTPTALDRILGARFGVKAVKLIEEKRFGRMVSYQSYRVSSVTIEQAVNRLKIVDPDGEVVRTARAIGIHMGD